MARNAQSLCREIRKETLKPKRTMEHVKDALRKNFRNRLKELRNESQNSGRNLADAINNLKIIESTIGVESSGLTSAEILELLEEVENELRLEQLMNECDQYERDTNAIFNADAVCAVCENYTWKISKICDQCSKSFEM